MRLLDLIGLVLVIGIVGGLMVSSNAKLQKKVNKLEYLLSNHFHAEDTLEEGYHDNRKVMTKVRIDSFNKWLSERKSPGDKRPDYYVVGEVNSDLSILSINSEKAIEINPLSRTFKEVPRDQKETIFRDSQVYLPTKDDWKSGANNK